MSTDISTHAIDTTELSEKWYRFFLRIPISNTGWIGYTSGPAITLSELVLVLDPARFNSETPL